MECFLLCDDCQKRTIYIKGIENKCTFCKSKIRIEEKIEDLVIVLNDAGVITLGSCEGHSDGFDLGKRSYPCVVFLNNKEIYKRAMEIIKGYNEIKEKENCFFWTIKHEITLSGWKPFIYPKEKNSENFYRETLLFARYIEGLF
jgi:hypothetical protein